MHYHLFANLDAFQHEQALETVKAIISYFRKISFYNTQFYVSLRRISLCIGRTLRNTHKWIKRLIADGVLELRQKGCWFICTSNVYFLNLKRGIHYVNEHNNPNGLPEIDSVINDLGNKVYDQERKIFNRKRGLSLLQTLQEQYDNCPRVPIHPAVIRIYSQTRSRVKTEYLLEHSPELIWIPQAEREHRPKCSKCNCLCRLKVSKNMKNFGACFWRCTKKGCGKCYPMFPGAPYLGYEDLIEEPKPQTPLELPKQIDDITLYQYGGLAQVILSRGIKAALSVLLTVKEQNPKERIRKVLEGFTTLVRSRVKDVAEFYPEYLLATSTGIILHPLRDELKAKTKAWMEAHCSAPWSRTIFKGKSLPEISAEYHQLALKYHPDTGTNKDPSKFVKLTNLYNKIKTYLSEMKACFEGEVLSDFGFKNGTFHKGQTVECKG